MKGLKDWKNRLLVLGATGCMIAAMAGCGSQADYLMGAAGETFSMNKSSSAMADTSYNYDYGYDGYTTESYTEEAAGEGGSAAEIVDDSAAEVNQGRKLIRTVNMDVETKEFEQAVSTVKQQVNALGGYVENMDTYNGSGYSDYYRSRYTNLTIRIPKDKADTFLEEVSDLCNVVSRSESMEDVTLTYVDLESHRNALRSEQDRLLELMEQAETIEDLITIEDRLTQVRYQLESMESQLRTYDNKIDYSTVYLNISEVKELTPVEEEDETVWERISGGFLESLKNVGEGLANFGIWFLVHIPYLAVWAVVIILLVVIIKAIIKSCQKRKQKKMAKTIPMPVMPVQNVPAQNVPTQNAPFANAPVGAPVQNTQNQTERKEDNHER